MALLDSFGRVIRYLRISVTDRCNLQCDYCRLVSEPMLPNHQELLTLEEIIRLGRLFVELGVDRLRLTGGEPLLRRNLLTLVKGLALLPGLGELSLTTNAVLLDRFAQPLREAGLQRVNISLDTLTPDVFAGITRGGELASVLLGIEAAKKAGLHPVKINMVVMRGVNDHEIPAMVDFARRHDLVLRFIETMPIGQAGQLTSDRLVPAEEILTRIQAIFGSEWLPISHGKGGGAGPARYFRLKGTETEVGVISARSRHFCETCNRMRLTSKGALVLCLGAVDRIDLKTSMRQGASDLDLTIQIQEAVALKPQRHQFDAANPTLNMAGLGG